MKNGRHVASIVNASPGDVIITRNGKRYTVTGNDGGIVHASHPGLRYGHWWESNDPHVTGMDQDDPVAVVAGRYANHLTVAPCGLQDAIDALWRFRDMPAQRKLLRHALYALRESNVVQPWPIHPVWR